MHCSATREGKWITAQDIDAMHKKRGWSMIGYHRVIRLDGSTQQGRPFNRRGAHVKGNNINTIGICMVGGLDRDGKAKDTFSEWQYFCLFAEITKLLERFPNIRTIKGHREYSPDLNGDGLIQPREWIKMCPCFNVSEFLEAEGIVV